MSTQVDITPEILLSAYAQGIFPMADSRDAKELYWVDPPMRGVFPLDAFHISRSLARKLRKAEFAATINTDFEGVLDACADRPETWINPTIRELYLALFEMGHAHSQEIWQDGRLVGGVYGVTLGAAFFGESMFSRVTDGSKLALAHLVDRLKRNGFVLFDTQFITDHLASLGAQEITRAQYHKDLSKALKLNAEFNR